MSCTSQIIGSTNRLLEGAPSAVVRTRETNLGDIIADAMVDNIAGTNFAAVRTCSVLSPRHTLAYDFTHQLLCSACHAASTLALCLACGLAAVVVASSIYSTHTT